MTQQSEILTEQEVKELSQALKANFNQLTYKAEFDADRKAVPVRSKLLKLSAVAASVAAVLAYSLLGNTSSSPAWSAVPIAVSEANQAAILKSCTSLLPLNSVQTSLHLTDFRGTFGSAILGSADSVTGELKSWGCDFTKSDDNTFKAFQINQAKFIPPVYTTSSTMSVPSHTLMLSNSKPVYEQIVWTGGDQIDGVKVPASQLILGSFENGANSVKVACPNLPTAMASISNSGSGLFSIWVPSASQDCKVTFFDKSGQEIK